MTIPNAPVKLLVDTNIWLDYFLARSKRHIEVSSFLAEAFEREDIALYVSSLSLKDIAYLLTSNMKADAKRAGLSITPQIAAAAQETAWACIRKVIEFALVAPVGQPDVLQAFTYRGIHGDFENDVQLGVAHRIGADHLLTHDADLARHAPTLCIDIERAKELLERGRYTS